MGGRERLVDVEGVVVVVRPVGGIRQMQRIG